jgi:GGDEF domain-containing protein
MTPHDLPAELSAVPLLPAREAVLARLAEQLESRAGEGRGSGSLLVIGLLRRDDGWPLSERTRNVVTTLLARSLRGEDWLGSSGDTEFVVLTGAPPVAAVSMAERLVGGIARLGVAGLCGAAGLVPLAGDADADELLRRATLALTTARRTGPGTVEPYREPVAAPLSW